jgi:thioredoxin
VSELDVSKPVFVYCLSGGRSASAAQYLKGRGFKRVYDLQGGIMQWRAAKLPLEQGGGGAKGAEMSQQAYEELIKSDQLVLVDFYAEWCQPCKRMAPYLAEISKEMADKVKVVRIDVEANRALSEKIGVTMLPTLLLYKGGKVSWKQEGFIEKEAVVKQIASR